MLAFNKFVRAHEGQRIVVLEIGAGKSIPTVRDMSERIGGTLIRINLDDPEGGDVVIASSALEALQAINTHMI